MMDYAGVFEKVDKPVFLEDMKKCFGEKILENKTLINRAFRYTDLPKQPYEGSACYQLFSPFDFEIGVGETISIPTCVKVSVSKGWIMIIKPKGDLGVGLRGSLANTIDVIENNSAKSPDITGHIIVRISNDGNFTLEIKEGDPIAECFFVQHGIADTIVIDRSAE